MVLAQLQTDRTVSLLVCKASRKRGCQWEGDKEVGTECKGKEM